MYRDPYTPAGIPRKREPEKKMEPVDFFHQEAYIHAPGQRRYAAPAEPVSYQPCRYVDGRHVAPGYQCPHRVEENDEITEVD